MVIALIAVGVGLFILIMLQNSAIIDLTEAVKALQRSINAIEELHAHRLDDIEDRMDA